MRAALLLALCCLAAAAAPACGNPAAPLGPCEISSTPFSPAPPGIVAVVSRIDYESGPVPAGFMLSQYVLWLTVPLGTTPNAGVTLGAGTPIFLRTGARAAVATTACAIRLGDRVELLHDQSVGYGAVQAPPGAPVYSGTQLVILR
jgi:hypothetical protein